MRVFNQVSGAPYADCFNPEEEWIVTSTDAASPKCIVRHSLLINFHKSCMMQGIITGKAFGAQQGNFNAWAGWAASHLPEHFDYDKAVAQIEAQNE